MNRELKFRAFDEKKKKMGRIFSLEDASYEGFPPPFVDKNGECDLKAKYIVMQFTGLLDKNGKEIYEGDIVKAEERFTTPKIVQYEIVFEDGAFIGVSSRKVDVVGKGKRTICLRGDEMIGGEIIGNIYENRDLLTNK